MTEKQEQKIENVLVAIYSELNGEDLGNLVSIGKALEKAASEARLERTLSSAAKLIGGMQARIYELESELEECGEKLFQASEYLTYK